jgi:hypothetical protein
MGWIDIKTTSRRAKTQRSETLKTHLKPDVGRRLSDTERAGLTELSVIESHDFHIAVLSTTGHDNPLAE